MAGKTNLVGDEPQNKSGNRTALIVVIAVLLVSVVLGVLSYTRLKDSETYLSRELDRMKEKGASLTAEGCVNEVLDWRPGCTAMVSLCDDAISRFVGACMDAANRVTYCRDLGGASSSTRFDFQECSGRAKTREEKTYCSIAMRTLDMKCKDILTRESP